MKKSFLTAVLSGFLLAISAEAQEDPTPDDQLRAHLHKDYFIHNLLIQSEGRFYFEDNDFQGGR